MIEPQITTYLDYLASELEHCVITAVDAPARLVFVTELVDRREDLANAILHKRKAQVFNLIDGSIKKTS